MKNTLTVMLLILVNICFGQNSNKEKLGLKTENLNWIQSLEKIDSKEKQIQFIIEKINQDSIVEFDNYLSDKMIITVGHGNLKSETNEQSKCKIVFVLSQKKSSILLDLNKYPNFSLILNYLTNETIKSIEILKDDKATSLYGSQAICGVVKLNGNNRELKKLIKKSIRK